jgi:serine/threonine protein kinase/Tol biopolymer transport system component
MGEVYKAKDTRLDRSVAIKVLPSHLSGNAELRQRFEREARAVSSLNHPHICTLHDIGEHEGIGFLVMEYLEGETLAGRLKKGALPLDQALRYGIEISDALDKAHRQGVVHRDLKPGNIMLTKSGTKLLDFGLAKLRVPETDTSAASALPTQEKPLTEKGSILGTFQYMSPEQLEAKDADERTDIFAFGAVLHEMVTGKRAFEGKSQASLITAIMSSEPPPLSTVQPMTPPLLDHVVKRCLAKEPDERWQAASDVMQEIRWIAETGDQAGKLLGTGTGRRIPSRLAVGIALGLAVGALLTSLVVWRLRPPPSPQPPMRFGINLPPNVRLTNTGRSVVALSPDGTQLVYSANNQLYLRPMDQMEATPIPGTEGTGMNTGRSPFFSPDGQWVGFWADGELKKVSVSGGAPVTLCEAGNPYGASWGSDDNIVFGQGAGGILRVAGEGGTPELLTPLDSTKGEIGHGPQILPGGRALLFTLATGGKWDEAQIVVQSLSVNSGERRVLIEGGSDARYAPTGHIVYALGETLFAVPFDLERLEVTAGPVPIVENVMRATGRFTGAAHYSFSDSLSLVYVPADTFQAARTLAWVDRQGQVRPLSGSRQAHLHPRFSPDGERLATRVLDESGGNIWILEMARDTLTRLTFEGSNNSPVWTPDGKNVAFTSKRSGQWNIFQKPADGSSEAVQLTRNENATILGSWSPDGKMLVAMVADDTSTSSFDIGALRPEGRSELEILLGTPFDEHYPRLSPDGRWLAYTSDESGRREVYVRSFPDLSGKWLISTEGGTEPVWSPNGKELFYRQGEKMFSIVVSTEPVFTPSKPVLLFEGPFDPDPNGFSSNYDVSPDGRRFLMIQRGEDTESAVPQRLNVVLNWFDELKRLVPTEPR